MNIRCNTWQPEENFFSINWRRIVSFSNTNKKYFLGVDEVSYLYIPSTMPFFSMNSAQHFNTIGTSLPEFSKCSPRSQPKTLSFRIPDCFNLLLDGLFRMKLLKNVINLPCFLRTGLIGVSANELKKKTSYKSLRSCPAL